MVNSPSWDEPAQLFLTAAVRAALDALPVAVWLSDQRGTPRFVNRRLLEYTGRSEADLLEGGLWEGGHPRSRDPALERRQGARLEREELLRAADGTYRRFLTQLGPVLSGERVAGWIGVGVELHDRRWERELLGRLAEVTADVVYLFDPRERRAVFVSRSVVSSLGREPGELEAVGPGLFPSLMHPDDRPRVLGRLSNLGAAGADEPIETEYRMRHLGGSWRWFRSRDVVFSSEPSGTPRLVLGVAEDVTERKRVEERTARLHAITAALVEPLTPEDVARVVLDEVVPALEAEGGSVVVAVEGGRELETLAASGYPEELVRAWRRFPVAAPTPLSEAVRTLEPVFLGSPQETVARYPVLAFVPGDWQALAAMPLACDGRAVGALGLSYRGPRAFDEAERAFARAVSQLCAGALERARLYEAERRARATLEARVEERTRELAAANAELAVLLDRLLVQNAALEAQRAELEAFVYTVNHDLRAPLTSIHGLGELLAGSLASGDGEESGRLLGRVGRNVGKMKTLLDKLLDFMTAGQAVEPSAPLDLGAAAKEALAEVEPMRLRRGARVELPPSWPVVRCPPTEAALLLANLLRNAVEWAGRGEAAGEPRLAVSWEQADGVVTLRVSDNGRGVPLELRERVFGLFQKLDPKGEGAGLGLATVRRIALRHGGRAWVEDSPPPPEGLGGASFAVTLPAARPGSP